MSKQTQPANASDPAKLEPAAADANRQDQPEVAEINGPKGPEPTRYGDWERKGRCVDF
jgi:hypothetical protein